MKKALQFAGLLAVAGCTIYGQTMDVQTTIPFTFHVTGTTMPAGEYRIHHSQGVLILREQQGKAVVALTVAAHKWDDSNHAMLQFNRYGDEYFLEKVSVPDSTVACQLSQSRREKELARGVSPVRTLTVAVQSK